MTRIRPIGVTCHMCILNGDIAWCVVYRYLTLHVGPGVIMIWSNVMYLQLQFTNYDYVYIFYNVYNIVHVPSSPT